METPYFRVACSLLIRALRQFRFPISVIFMMSIRNVILKSDEPPEVSQEQDEEVRTYKEARNKKERERYRDVGFSETIYSD